MRTYTKIVVFALPFVMPLSQAANSGPERTAQSIGYSTYDTAPPKQSLSEEAATEFFKKLPQHYAQTESNNPDQKGNVQKPNPKTTQEASSSTRNCKISTRLISPEAEIEACKISEKSTRSVDISKKLLEFSKEYVRYVTHLDRGEKLTLHKYTMSNHEHRWIYEDARSLLSGYVTPSNRISRITEHKIKLNFITRIQTLSYSLREIDPTHCFFFTRNTRRHRVDGYFCRPDHTYTVSDMKTKLRLIKF